MKHQDDMLELRELLFSGNVISLRGKTYHLYPDFATEKLLYISNHGNYIPKRIAMYFHNREHIVLDGQGAVLVMHGIVLPAVFQNCTDVVFKNITIRYEDPMILQAVVTEAYGDVVRVETQNGQRYFIRNGKLYCRGYQFERALRDYSELEISSESGKIAENWGDGCFGVSLRKCCVLQHDTGFEIHGVKRLPKKGSRILFRFGGREAPAVFVENCRSVYLENVVIQSAPGMGVLAQNCTDFTLRSCRVVPSEKMWSSTNFDATHFVGCSGHIQLENCIFSRQMDDGLNVQGIYTTVERLYSEKILIKYNHPQHKGTGLFQTDDVLLMRQRDTLFPVCTVCVKDVEVLNRDYTLLTIDRSSKNINVGMLVENLTKSPSVTVRGCVFEQNRARGMLLASSGRILIENNRIQVPGAGILLECDALYWYESGAVHDLLIRRNMFIECSYRREWGVAAVAIVSPPKLLKDFYYHNNIRIEENVFRNCGAVANIVSVDGICIAGNKIYGSNSVVTEHCRNEQIEL